MNKYPFQRGELPSLYTPTNKGWLLWTIELMPYTPKVHRATIIANPCSSSYSSSKSALYSYLQPQLLHFFGGNMAMIRDAKY